MLPVHVTLASAIFLRGMCHAPMMLVLTSCVQDQQQSRKLKACWESSLHVVTSLRTRLAKLTWQAQYFSILGTDYVEIQHLGNL